MRLRLELYLNVSMHDLPGVQLSNVGTPSITIPKAFLLTRPDILSSRVRIQDFLGDSSHCILKCSTFLPPGGLGRRLPVRIRADEVWQVRADGVEDVLGWD
jgi:hypothetical protein